MKVALFIPTYNAVSSCYDTFTQTLQTIRDANLYHVLIIDSSSEDNTVDVVKSFGFDCRIIPKAEFNHGRTRELALELLSDSDIVIYLTQDVLLKDKLSITKLVTPLLVDKEVAGCYGRQLPHKTADLFARHLRKFNYGDQSYIREYSDRYIYGMNCVFSSDSFASYRVDVLKRVGGFPKHIIFGEDAYIFAKLLQNGYKVAYQADAICYHSHNYKIMSDFKRYFDIGVFHRSENWILQDFGHLSKQGIKFLFSELRFLSIAPWLWPKSIIKLATKYIGYKFGRNYDKIGVRLCRKFSMNKDFWQ